MTKTIDLLCLGDPCADVVIGCERAPAWDDKCQGEALGLHAGGTEANVACAASRLGWRAAVFGEVGDDAHSGFLLDAFDRDGVSTQWLTRRPGAASASTIVFVSPQGERSIVWVPLPPRPATSPTDLEAAIATSRVVYTMPYDGAVLAALREATRRHGAQLAIDVEREAAREPGLLNQFLGLSDVAFLNESGYIAAIGRPADEAGVLALQRRSAARIVVVTLGAHGAIAASAERVVRTSAVPVDVVDTTGAGDSFNAAFLVADGRGLALAPALAFACTAASLTVGVVGARTALPAFTALQALLPRSARAGDGPPG